MRLTNVANYAIRALVELAGQPDSQRLLARVIARRRSIPHRFLQKVLRELERRGIVWAIRGPGGGYELAKAPKDITLLEIIEAVDGPVRSQGEFDGVAGGTLGKKLQAVWNQMDEEVRRQLGKVRLPDLVEKDRPASHHWLRETAPSAPSFRERGRQWPGSGRHPKG